MEDATATGAAAAPGDGKVIEVDFQKGHKVGVEEGQAVERQRVAAINDFATVAAMGMTDARAAERIRGIAAEHCAKGSSVEDARKAIVEAKASVTSSAEVHGEIATEAKRYLTTEEIYESRRNRITTAVGRAG